MNIHEVAQRTGETVVKALDKAGEAEEKFFLRVGTGIDKGAKEIKKKYIPVVLATFLTFATVAGAACDNNPNSTKIPDSNIPTVGQIVPENGASMEQIARVEEINKIRGMLDGHNLTPDVQNDIDSFLSTLPNRSPSEYSDIVKKDTIPSSDRIEYTVLCDNIPIFPFSKFFIRTFVVSSAPSGLPGSNSTYERLDLTANDRIPATADDIRKFRGMYDDYNKEVPRVPKLDLTYLFPKDMAKRHTEFMGTTSGLPTFEAYTNHGADETVAGTFSATASITYRGPDQISIERTGEVFREEKLSHVYARNKAVVPVEAPVKVSPTKAESDSIGQQFNVEITNPAKAIAFFADHVDSALPMQWDEVRLKILRDTLTKLPEYFYQPDEQGKKLEIRLTTGRFSNVPKNIMELSYAQFDPKNPIGASSFIVSRFTYRVMEFNARADGLILSSPLGDKLDQALGKNWTNMGDTVEFIPNLSADYVRGKDYFTSKYGQIYTSDQVGIIYNFVKEDIFKGKEY